MKTLASASFFRTFDLLVGAGNPDLRSHSWDIDGVRFERERHSYDGRACAFTLEVFSLTRPGRQGWALIVAKEYWRAGAGQRPIRTGHWNKRLAGSSRDILTWMRVQENALERKALHRVDRARAAG